MRRSKTATDVEAIDRIESAVRVTRLDVEALRRDVERLTLVLAKLALLVSVRRARDGRDDDEKKPTSVPEAITSSRRVEKSRVDRRDDKSKRKSESRKRKSTTRSL